MKYDYFAYVFNKNDVINKKQEIRNDKKIKLNDKVEEWRLYNEPIKTHLLFKDFENDTHYSWKNVLTEFYQRKVNDLNNDLSKKLPKIFEKNYDISLGNVIFFSIKLSSPFFTASENKFYSIQNPIAKERVTGLPLLKGSSLKGALRQAAIDVIETELMKQYFNDYTDLSEEQILDKEKNEGEKDRFFFKRRARLVRLFGNERDVNWFTFKSLLATGGIKNVSKTKEILGKISGAFENYLKYKKIVNSEGVCKGRLIFEDLYFKKVTLDVITPLDRRKRTPVHGPIFYEVVPSGEEVKGKLIWFPFDLVANGEFEKIESEWKEDKEIIERAFERLSEKGIGAKTKDGWGRFDLEEI